MGYTHYWRRPRRLPKAAFARVVSDLTTILPTLAASDVVLAGFNGEGEAVISAKEIGFNGARACGHSENTAIGMRWTATDANGAVQSDQEAISVRGLTGKTFTARVCDGDCSYETFLFSQTFEPLAWQVPEDGRYFEFCKTARRPYDLAVTACLVIAKHHFRDLIRVTSDGEPVNWQDAMLLCQLELGYGMGFRLDE